MKSNQSIKPQELLKLAVVHWKVIVVIVAACTGYAYNETRSYKPKYESSSAVEIKEKEILSAGSASESDARDEDILLTYVEKAESTAVMRAAIEASEWLQEYFEVDMSDEASIIAAAKDMSPASARLRGDSLIIDLTADGRNKDLVYNTAKYVALGFEIADKLEKTKVDQNALDTLINESLPDATNKVNEASQKLLAFEIKSTMTNFETRRDDLTGLKNNTEIAALDLQKKIRRLESDLVRIKELGYVIDGDKANNLTIISNKFSSFRAIQSIYEDEKYAESFREYETQQDNVKRMSIHLREGHSEMKEAIKEAQLYHDAVVATIEDVPQTIMLNKSIYEDQLSDLEFDVNAFTKDLEKLATLKSEYTTLNNAKERAQLYQEHIEDRIEELKTSINTVASSVSPFEDASEPSSSMEDKNQTILMGFLVGLGLSYGFLYLLSMMDQSIKSVEQAEQVLQLPVLAAVPAAEPDGQEVKNRLIMKGSSNSTCSEAFRSLRVNIESMNRSKSNKVVLFTSSMPSEGKTFTSINYSASLAQQGHKTLLIDMDLRKPAVAKDFDIEKSNYIGLTEIITSEEKLEQFPDLPMYEPAEGLSVLHGGPLIDNPAERLSSYAVERIIEKAREHYDRVIIDSAPLGPVGDTLTVARLADMVCLVVRSAKTPSKIILRIIDTLHRHGHTPAGIVLNFMKIKSGYGSYYYYYSSDKEPEITSSSSTTPKKTPYKRKSNSSAETDNAPTNIVRGDLEDSTPKKKQIPSEYGQDLNLQTKYVRRKKPVESHPSA